MVAAAADAAGRSDKAAAEDAGLGGREGLALIVNTSAGTASARLARRLAEDLPEATITEAGAAQDLIRQLRDGEAVQVGLGLVGGRPFVNTSSTGV
jgi:hypothetical protein